MYTNWTGIELGTGKRMVCREAGHAIRRESGHPVRRRFSNPADAFSK